MDVGKVICSFDETLMSTSFIVLFRKGNLLLDRFNILMRRCLEAGLLQKLRTELDHRASLRGRGRFTQAVNDMFFAFSVSHLIPAFVALIVGTLLSSVLFIDELILNCLCKSREKNNSRIRRVRMLFSIIAYITDVD